MRQVCLALDSLDQTELERRGGQKGEEGRGVKSFICLESEGFKVVAVVADGCPLRVMPWDSCAFWQLELEILSCFCPPSGAALILVPGEAPGHQWQQCEEWTP